MTRMMWGIISMSTFHGTYVSEECGDGGGAENFRKYLVKGHVNHGLPSITPPSGKGSL